MDSKKLPELKALAKDAKITNYSKMSKMQLIAALSDKPMTCANGVCLLDVNNIKLESDTDKHDLDTVLMKTTKKRLEDVSRKHGIVDELKTTKQEMFDDLLDKVYFDVLEELIS
jgi:hypothetical protein